MKSRRVAVLFSLLAASCDQRTTPNEIMKPSASAAPAPSTKTASGGEYREFSIPVDERCWMASYGKLYAVTVVSSRVTFERPAEVDPKYTQMTKDPMRTLVSIECEVDKARCLVARMELGGVDRGMKLRASELSAGLFDDPEKLIKLSEKRWMVKGKFGGETEIDLTEGKVRLTMDDKEMHLRGEGKCVVGEPPSAR